MRDRIRAQVCKRNRRAAVKQSAMLNKIGAKRFFWSVVALCSALLQSGCGRPAPGELHGKNLIVICIDTLRADHLGCYGYRRNTSPNIDRLAREGVRFEQAHSHSSFTRESVSTILTGLLPSSSGSSGWFAKPVQGVQGLGSLFTRAGYRSAFITAMHMLKGFDAGFTEARHFSQSKVSGNSPQLSRYAIDFIRRHRSGPFMLYLHYLDPHGPYEPPDQQYLRFAEKRYPTDPSIHNDLRIRCVDMVRQGFVPGQPAYEDMILRYDAEIAHTDQAVGMLLDALSEMDLLDDTLIVITADHGEEFLEHGYVEHGWTLYEECTHVPLIFWSRAIRRPETCPGPVSLVSVLPTLVSLLNIPCEGNDFDGQVLFGLQRGRVRWETTDPVHIGELLVQHRNLCRTVQAGKWKYIEFPQYISPADRPKRYMMDVEAYERNLAGHVPAWKQPVRVELYDLLTDPEERTNLADARPELCADFRRRLEAYRQKCRQRRRFGEKSQTMEGPKNPKEIEQLKSLGYL